MTVPAYIPSIEIKMLILNDALSLLPRNAGISRSPTNVTSPMYHTSLVLQNVLQKQIIHTSLLLSQNRRFLLSSTDTALGGIEWYCSRFSSL